MIVVVTLAFVASFYNKKCFDGWKNSFSENMMNCGDVFFLCGTLINCLFWCLTCYFLIDNAFICWFYSSKRDVNYKLILSSGKCKGKIEVMTLLMISMIKYINYFMKLKFSSFWYNFKIISLIIF